MAEAVAGSPPRVSNVAGSKSVPLIAWRNLWRNRRRTWLTSGGIAFAVWMLVFALSMQDGTFEIMIDNGARMMLGHVQIQHPDYRDNPRLENTVSVSEEFFETLASLDGVEVIAPRVQSFALFSVGERSFGAQVVGVDVRKEALWSTLPGMVEKGRYLEGPGEVFMGSALARNLNAQTGDEVVLLGTAKEGGVAAAVVKLVGTYTSGQVELDRAIAQIDIEEFRTGWDLSSDEVHAVIVLADSVKDSERLSAEIQALIADEDRVVLGWRDLMPEAQQTIDLKYIGAAFFFVLIAIIVTFSVVNTFMMTVFERTAEFGMLMAIGMRPRSIMLQVQIEAFWLAVLGVALGIAVSAAMLVPLGITGMPLPAEAEEMLKQYNIPDRMYPSFSTTAVWISGLIMFVGTQIAALVPAMRIRRMRPVEALRSKE